MRTTNPVLQDRNTEIGKILHEARTLKNISITQCATIASTTRKRYIAMELGTALIGAAELEVLVEFLDIPPQKIWRGANKQNLVKQVLIPAVPGEMVQILVVDAFINK